MSLIKHTGLEMRIKNVHGYWRVPNSTTTFNQKKCYNHDFFEVIEAKRGQWFKILGLQRKFLNFTFWKYPTLFLYGLSSKVSVKNLKKLFLRSSIFRFPESENLPLIVPLGFLNIHAHVSSIAAIIRLTLIFWPKPKHFSLGVNM